MKGSWDFLKISCSPQTWPSHRNFKPSYSTVCCSQVPSKTCTAHSEAVIAPGPKWEVLPVALLRLILRWPCWLSKSQIELVLAVCEIWSWSLLQRSNTFTASRDLAALPRGSCGVAVVNPSVENLFAHDIRLSSSFTATPGNICFSMVFLFWLWTDYSNDLSWIVFLKAFCSLYPACKSRTQTPLSEVEEEGKD